MLISIYTYLFNNLAKVSVFWEKPLYTAMESDGSVTVKLISSKPVPFNYTVQVSATDISAQRKFKI